MDDSAEATRPAARALKDLMTVGDETDALGRLLLEDSATKEARRGAVQRGILMRSSFCPYRDSPSRFGGRMNASAFDTLRDDTAQILDGFAWLRRELLARTPAVEGTVQHLYDVSYLGVTLPLVLFHRAGDPIPPHGALPTVVASIFKASRGLFSVAVDMLNRNGPGRPVDAAEVVGFAEAHGHFVHPSPPRVSAAPTRLIERTISTILNGHGADAGESPLGDLVSFPALWRFYRVQDDLSQALSTYGHILGRLSPPAQPSRAVPPRQLFAMEVPGTRGTFGQLTEAVLAHLNSAQAELNRILGRDDTLSPLGYPQLLDLL